MPVRRARSVLQRLLGVLQGGLELVHDPYCRSEVKCGIIYGTWSYSGESTKLRIPASSGIGRK